MEKWRYKKKGAVINVRRKSKFQRSLESNSEASRKQLDALTDTVPKDILEVMSCGTMCERCTKESCKVPNTRSQLDKIQFIDGMS